jgi:hypothetical protein
MSIAYERKAIHMKRQKTMQLKRLLEDTNEAFYWAGFLMADGCVTINRVTLVLAKQDWNHVREFGKFVRYTGHRKPCRGAWGVSGMDRNIAPLIRDKFRFKDCKTYHPPDRLPLGNNDQIVSFIVGFIDGDGSMRLPKKHKFCNITVKVHSSWIGMLNRMAKFVYELSGESSGKPKINSSGYAEWIISNSVVTKFLKSKSIELSIPFMRRKWDRIDENDVGIQEQAKARVIGIRAMVVGGLYKSQIARALGMTDSGVLELAKRYNIRVPRCVTYLSSPGRK